uniref:Uncharacterized protein YtfN n=1 Tax=Rheinheimera sp. BAL341 TaxID=1708203 RepID=A0A486XJQ3_9GAMM
MSWQRSKRLAKHSLKWLNWTLFLPAALVAVMLTLLLYTATGLRVSLALAEHLLPGFTVETSSGSILAGNTLSNLHWQEGNNSVAVQQLRLSINNHCLLQLKLCVEELAVQGLSIKMEPALSEPQQENTASTRFWLAFPLSINDLSLDDALVSIDGHQLRWQHLAMTVDAWGSKIQLTKPLWQQVSLTLAPTAQTQAATASFVYQAPKLADFQLPLSVFIEQFKLDDFILIQEDSQYKLAQLQFSLQWQEQTLNLTQFELSHSIGTLQSSGRITTTAAYPLSVSALVNITDGELAGQRLQLTGSGSLADLAITASATGPLQAQLDANLDLLSEALTHQLQFTSNTLLWPLPRATANTETALRVNEARVNLSGSLAHTDISGRFNISSLQAPDSAVEFNGQADYHSLKLNNLQFNTLGGHIRSALTLDWRKDLTWQSQTQLHAIEPGLFWPDYPGELNGTIQHQGTVSQTGPWQLSVTALDISGTLRDYAMQLNGEMSISDRSGKGDYQFNSPNLVLHHADNSLALSGQVDEDWQLTLQLDLPDLAQTLHHAHGKLNGQFDVTGKWAQPHLRGTISGSELKLQQFNLQQINLETALWRDATQAWHTETHLTASAGNYKQLQLEQLDLRFSGNEQQHQLSLILDAVEHSARLTLSGSLQDATWQATLQDAIFQSLPGQWQLTAPASLQYQGQQQQLSVSPHCWQQQASQLCADKTVVISPQQLTTSLTLSQFPLSSVQAVLPYNTIASGSLDAALTANWQQGTPATASLSVSSKTGSVTTLLATPLTLAWQRLVLNSTLSNNSLQNTLQLQVDQQAALSANVNISNFNQDNKALSGEITLKHFTIDFLQPLLGEFSELTGLAAADIRLSGSLQQPLLYGSAELQNSRVKGKLAPVDIDNAALAVTFSGQTASLDGLVSTPKGEINLSGVAQWHQMDAWQAQLNIKGDELRLQVPQASLQIAPDLMLTANSQRTLISGSVNIPIANINIDNLPARAVELSDDVVLLDTQLQPIVAEQKQTFALETDINVVLGKRVRLLAFGLKTRLAGNLRVRQLAEQPLRVNGDVSLIDGTFRAYGQDLLIRKGKFNFNGPADQPFLTVEAIRNPANMEDDVIAGIRVNGPADDPSVVVFSEPAKAQANALAYLLMGRDLDSSSGNTGNAVTTSLIGMTLSSSSKLVGEIGEAFGLKDFTLDTAGAGDKSQVTVSGYLSRDLQLKYGYGIFNAVGEFTLRYRVMRRLYLEVVSGVDTAVDLLYKFEFD